MHEIKLIQYTRPDKTSGKTSERLYSVWVPNNERFYFTSKRNLLRWLAELNRHLNQLAHELNGLTADCFAEYRYYYFHLNTIERGEIESLFNGINRMFGLLVTRSQSANGNAFTYDRLNNIASGLLDIVANLERNPLNKISTVQRYRLQNLRLRITRVRDSLAWFPER